MTTYNELKTELSDRPSYVKDGTDAFGNSVYYSDGVLYALEKDLIRQIELARGLSEFSLAGRCACSLDPNEKEIVPSETMVYETSLGDSPVDGAVMMTREGDKVFVYFPFEHLPQMG